MTNKICMIVMLLSCVITPSSAADSESRQLARQIYLGSAESYNLESLTEVFLAGGYSETESRLEAANIMEMLNSEGFVQKIEDVYIKYFTKEELKQISLALENPAFSKFLRLRPQIQKDMARVFSEASSNTIE